MIDPDPAAPIGDPWFALIVALTGLGPGDDDDDDDEGAGGGGSGGSIDPDDDEGYDDDDDDEDEEPLQVAPSMAAVTIAAPQQIVLQSVRCGDLRNSTVARRSW